MEIKHMSPEEIEAHKREHPQSEAKEWALVDGDLIFDFYDTEEKAKAELDEWNVRDMVENGFREWAHKIAGQIGVDVQKVVEIVKQSV